MNKIHWCKRKQGGLRLDEPNENLSQAYLHKAEEALTSMRINIIKDWQISTAYYALYFSLYAILVRIGIRCEIHACTITFAKHFLKAFFDHNDIVFLEDALQARIDAQYYVDRAVPDNQFKRMITTAPSFLVTCKSILAALSEKKVDEIRKKYGKSPV